MWQFRPSWPGQLSCSFHGKQERQQRADRWRVVGYSSTTTLGLGGDCQLSSSVQFQCGHSRRTGYVACSPGSVLWSERKHGQGETEFAPVHLLRYGKALRMFSSYAACGIGDAMPSPGLCRVDVNQRRLALSRCAYVINRIRHSPKESETLQESQ